MFFMMYFYENLFHALSLLLRSSNNVMQKGVISCDASFSCDGVIFCLIMDVLLSNLV